MNRSNYGETLMMTRLIFSDSNKNLEIAKKQLEKKYESVEELLAEIQKHQCNAPEHIDDYILWQAIITLDKQMQDYNINVSGTTPPFVFKEEIVYHTSEFYSVLTPRRMELMDYISKKNPKSVKDLAKELNRDYKNVYDDLLALQRFHLIEFIREGKNKRPVAKLSAIEVILHK